jgi:hypothetical protein
MMNFVKAQMIFSLITMIIKKIDPEQVEYMVDKGLDYIEEVFSDNTPVIAACDLVREAFSIEDNDPE